MWPVIGVQLDTSWLDMQPIRILYEFDGPRAFTCQDNGDNLYLSYQVDEDERALRFLVVPFSKELERRLTTGMIDVWNALFQEEAWLFDLDNQWQPSRAWKVNFEDLPQNAIPKPGVMLWSHLQPKFGVILNLPRSSTTQTRSVSGPSGIRSQMWMPALVG